MRVRASTVLRACTAPLACLALAAPAGAADGHPEAVLAEAEALVGPGAAPPADSHPQEVTMVLAELAAVAPQLEGEDRRTANAILARPDNGASDQYGDGYSVDEPVASPACSANFCVHWVNSTSDAPDLDDENGTDDGDGVPDFVEETLTAVDHSHAVENGSLGWAEPLSDGARGGGGAGLTDVYLIETNGSYFGYSSPDEGQGTAISKHAYLVLDEDNEEFVDDELTALEALQVTAAHEYNHVLQFTYDSRMITRNLWMLESVATWVEEHVYPAIDDYLRYVPTFAQNTRNPLTGNAGGLKIYGAALWNHYLETVDGEDVMRQAWEDIDGVTPAHLPVAAYDSALGGDGATPFDTLGERFASFAGASAEWRNASLGFPDAAQLPDATRSGRIVPGGRAVRSKLDHLSFALLKVPAGEATEDLVLSVRCPEGVHCGAALVTRDGNATTGDVDAGAESLLDGGRVTDSIEGGDYDRVTAVIVNADASVNGSGERYTSDGTRLKAKLVAG